MYVNKRTLPDMDTSDLEKLSEDELQALVLEHYPTAKRVGEASYGAICYRIMAAEKLFPLERFSKEAWSAAARKVVQKAHP